MDRFTPLIFALLFGPAISFPVQADETSITPELTLNQDLDGATFRYQQFNTELGSPCPQVALLILGQVRENRALCQYRDRFDRPFDLRTDVSFVEITDAAIQGQQLSFSADISLKEADAFVLDCALPFTHQALGPMQCRLREQDQ